MEANKRMQLNTVSQLFWGRGGGGVGEGMGGGGGGVGRRLFSC